MQNLAGASEATRYAAVELDRAGIPIVPAAEVERETRTEIEGELRTATHAARFTRRWAYWSVTITPPLSADQAVMLNDTPGTGGGTKYSGDGSSLGSVVRAHGFAGGMSSAQIREWGECSTWHIDTPEGLKAFAEWFRNNMEPAPRS